MKKWIIMLGVLVSLIVLLLIRSDDRMLQTGHLPGSPAIRLEKQNPRLLSDAEKIKRLQQTGYKFFTVRF